MAAGEGNPQAHVEISSRPGDYRADNEPMDEVDLSNILATYISDAVGYVEDEQVEYRLQAQDYYEAKPLGNETEGSSDIVVSVFRDQVEYLMPQLMRIFMSPLHPARFMPRGPEDITHAEQATDLVNHVFMNECDGYRITETWLKTGLIYRLGTVKWWWEWDEKVEEEEYTGLTEAAYRVLTVDPDVEIVEEVAYPGSGAPVSGPEAVGPSPMPLDGFAAPGAPEAPPELFYDCTIRRTIREGRVKVDVMAPEEFIYNRTAKSIDDATFISHRQLLTETELVDRGYDPDVVATLPRADDDFSEERERRYDEFGGVAPSDTDPPDETMTRKLIYECYLFVDYDGDGIAEWRRVVAGDRGMVILENDPWVGRPFAPVSPITVPHQLTGQSLGDLTMDIQHISSTVMRQALEGLVAQNNPRVAYVEGEVNEVDLFENETGGGVRMNRPGMIEPFALPDTAKQALPFLQYLDRIVEKRTGINETSMGLNADKLQSTTEVAVDAQVNAAQAKSEMIARNYAWGLARIYSGILQLLQQHQDKPKVIRLRGEFVPMDPRSWNSDMDVEPLVGLGTGAERERIGAMSQIIADQDKIMAQAGPGNGLVTTQGMFNARERWLEMAGFRHAEQYYQKPPEGHDEELQERRAQAGQAESQAKLAEAQLDAQVEMQKAQMKHQVDVLKAQADIQLKREQMLMQLQLQAAQMQGDAALKERELAIESMLKAQELQTETALKEAELATEAALKSEETNLNFQANIRRPN